MEIKDIKDLINLIHKSDISSLEIEREDIKISIKKDQISGGNTADKVKYLEEIKPRRDESVIYEDIGESQDDLHTIASPIVGTFYKSANPESKPFIKVGDRVEKGQTICIIEAMKIMNEIESDVSGEVVEILLEDEDNVEFGQPLIKIRR